MKYHYGIFMHNKLISTSEKAGFNGYLNEQAAKDAGAKDRLYKELPYYHIVILNRGQKEKDIGGTIGGILIMIIMITIAGAVLYEFWSTVTQIIVFLLVLVGLFSFVNRR